MASMIEIFPDPASQAAAAASAIVQSLTYRLRLRGSASMVGTGGRSAGAVYDALCNAALDWTKVDVTLSDERFVDTTSPDSNERLTRERLLQNRAARANFVGLRGDASTPEAAAAAASAVLADWPPFDVTLLGMGEDGHIASLFPGNPSLPLGLDRAAPPCIAVPQGEGMAPAQPRLSLSLPRLVSSRLVLLVAAGAEKRRVLERAMDDSDSTPFPVRALLKSAPTRRILWTA
jgi:6-phosphogluconolactonase